MEVKTGDGLMRSLEAGVLTLMLDRPGARNAIDPELRDALASSLDAAASEPAVRGVVITGAGGNFCAGGDLRRFEDLHDPTSTTRAPTGTCRTASPI